MKKHRNRKYTDLSPFFQKFFAKFGVYKIDGTAKPYYAATKQGKILRVVAPNKLKEMKDGATPTEYGYVKLKQTDGTFKEFGTHQLIGHFIPNPENKPVINHLFLARNRNKIDELEWATYSENAKHYLEHKNERNDEI